MQRLQLNGPLKPYEIPVCARLPLALVLAGCDMGMAHLTGTRREWITTLVWAAKLRIANTNGKIDVEASGWAGGRGSRREIARAATDAGAKELLPRIKIAIEDVAPDRVSASRPRGSVDLGDWRRVRGAGITSVRPRACSSASRTRTGGYRAERPGGKVHARTTNGAVVAKAITGGVASTTTWRW